MVYLMLSPPWFFGYDLSFELFSFVVCFLLALFSFRIYSYARTEKHKFMYIGFFILALSFFVKLVTNLSIYFKVLFTWPMVLHSALITYFGGLILYRFLFLMGITLLYFMVMRRKNASTLGILLTAEFLVAWLSVFSFIAYHILATVILFFVYRNLKHTSKIVKVSTAKYVTLGFLFILLSQITFILYSINVEFYVLAEMSQLIGFVCILIALLKVLLKK